MKKLYGLLSLALLFDITHLCSAQDPSIVWQKTLGGPGNDIIEDISPTLDGNYILLALASQNGEDVSCDIHGIHDIWIVKVDPEGNIIWQQCFGGSKEEGNPNSKIIPTSDGGYYFITETWSNDFDVTGHLSKSDIWTVKLDSLGAMVWSRCYGGSQFDVPRKIYELPNNKFLILGRSTSDDFDVPDNIDTANFDAWVFVINSTGGIVLDKVYGGTGDDEFYQVQSSPDGNLVLFGQTSSHDGDLAGLNVHATDAWVLKINPFGDILFSKVYGQAEDEYFLDAISTPDSGFVAFGESGDPGIPMDKGSYHGDHDYWTMKIDRFGIIQWQGMYGGSGLEQLTRVMLAPDSSSYYLVGTTTSQDGDVTGNDFNGRDWWFVNLDLDGNLLWETALGGSLPDYCYSIAGPAIAVGGTYSPDGDVIDLDGEADGWIMQLDYASLTHPVAPKEQAMNIYPNPAGDVIYVEMKGMENINMLEIKNVFGQVIYSSGISGNKIELPVRGFISGTYLLTVSGNDITSKKMMIVSH